MKAAVILPKFVSFKEAERLTGISRFTLKRIVDRNTGELPVIRPEGVRIARTCVDDLAALLERWKRDAADGVR